MSGFATSAAAFGIKSNAPANASAFGGPKPTGSLFGGSAPQSSIFGGNQPQQQNQTATAPLFGASQQPQQPNQLFGAGNQANQSSNTPFGGFGAQNQQQAPPQQNAFGSSLFGANNNNQQQQQSNQPGQQQSNAFGGFGSFQSNQNTNQQQQQQPAWGVSSTTQPNSLQNQPTQPSTFFSNPNTSAGSSLFAKPQQSQPLTGLGNLQQQQQPQQQSQPVFTRTTKFNDLPDQLKKTFEDIDSHIQGRVQISNDLKQRKLGEEALKGQEVIRSLHNVLVNTTSIVHLDLFLTKDLKTKADQGVQDTIVLTRIIDGFKNPQQCGAYLKNYASFPFEYFSRIAEDMKKRLTWCKSTIEQIERKLSSSPGQGQHTPQAISATLQAQHTTFVNLASKTAALDGELQKLKQLYTQLWRAKTGSARDPFEAAGREESEGFGLSTLSVN